MKLCNGVLIAFALLVVAGCSTTPEAQTATRVEDRKPPAASTATTAPVRSPKIATVDLSKPTSKPLAAPADTLSKRTVFFAYDQFEIADEYRPLLEAHARHLRAN